MKVEPPQAGAWAIKLGAEDSRALAALRLKQGISVLEADGEVWARGDSLDESLDIELRKLPGKRFSISGEGRLVAMGKRIPRGKLPQGEWTEISRWCSPKIQTAALPGAGISKASLKWDRSHQTGDPAILVTSAANWRRWAIDAPMVRLEKLRFALCEDGRALVWGKPLPPIAGERYVESCGIAWPAGLEPSPCVDASVIAEMLELNEGNLAMFDGGEGYELIEGKAFVNATRAAVRGSIESSVIS